MVNIKKLLNKFTRIKRTANKKNAIIVDIDNTLCETDFIFDEIQKNQLSGAAKWGYFNSNVQRCPVNAWCIMLVINYLILGYDVIFLTARSEKISKETEAYLFQYLPEQFRSNIHLFMRQADDISPAWNVKEKWLNEIEDAYCFSFAVDDDIDNCRMFYARGIPVLCPVHKELLTKIPSQVLS